MKTLLFLTFVLLITSCTQKDSTSDAYGQFEAKELLLSTEVGGLLVFQGVKEGDMVQKNTLLALVDTASITLKIEEVIRQMDQLTHSKNVLDAERKVVQAQRGVAQNTYNRIRRLFDEKAATPQQKDDAEGQLTILEAQYASFGSKLASIPLEFKTMQTRLAQLKLLKEKHRLIAPIQGTVLETYVEQGELTHPTKPLLKLADLSEMKLSVYVSGVQLSQLSLGQKVMVEFDRTETENESRTGTIAYIASEAEFTPKTIQTKDERVLQVYEVIIRVDNADGKLKIGMPGEVQF